MLTSFTFPFNSFSYLPKLVVTVMAAESTPSHVRVLRPSRSTRKPPSHRTPGRTEEPFCQPTQLDNQLDTTTSQTLEESAQSSIIDFKPPSLFKGLGIDNSSQWTKNDYATPSLVSLPPELQATIASFVSVMCAHNLPPYVEPIGE